MTTPDESTGQSIGDSLQTKKSGSKRKAFGPPVGLIEMLGRMQDDTNERLDKLTNRIGFEFDLSEARKEVIDILSGIPDLTLVQQIDASKIIIDKVERVKLVMRLPEAFVCWRSTTTFECNISVFCAPCLHPALVLLYNNVAKLYYADNYF